MSRSSELKSDSWPPDPYISSLTPKRAMCLPLKLHTVHSFYACLTLPDPYTCTQLDSFLPPAPRSDVDSSGVVYTPFSSDPHSNRIDTTSSHFSSLPFTRSNHLNSEPTRPTVIRVKRRTGVHSLSSCTAHHTSSLEDRSISSPAQVNLFFLCHLYLSIVPSAVPPNRLDLHWHRYILPLQPSNPTFLASSASSASPRDP